MFHQVCEDRGLGPLDETLKWGQPSWRPTKPRTGSTLRMGWWPKLPDRIAVFVDCKTDLASRMRDIYPDIADNDGQRQLGILLDAPLPEQALAHLAEMTFAYHLDKRANA